MNKILTFICNQDKKLLLLKGSSTDPQLKKSIWYVVTGGCEECDNTKEDTVKREIKEETNLDAKKIIYLKWILKYEALGEECTEYAYITFVDEKEIILNEEHIDFKWLDKDEFIDRIDWFGDKNVLKLVLDKALKSEIYFEKTKIQEI